MNSVHSHKVASNFRLSFLGQYCLSVIITNNTRWQENRKRNSYNKRIDQTTRTSNKSVLLSTFLINTLIKKTNLDLCQGVKEDRICKAKVNQTESIFWVCETFD